MLIPFDELFKKYQIQTSGILHLGANLGQEREMYAKVGVHQVIWVEALPHLFQQLVKETSRFLGSMCLQACVADKDGDLVKFNIASNGGQSSSLLDFGTHTVEHPTVRFTGTVTLKTTRVDTLLKENGIKLNGDHGWFLNADLQGAELLALKGMGDLLWKFEYAYIEVNDKHLYKGCPLTADIDAYLAGFGFMPLETKMTGAGWGDRFYKRFAKS